MKKQYIQPNMKVHSLRIESVLIRISQVKARKYDVNETPEFRRANEWGINNNVQEDDGTQSVY